MTKGAPLSGHLSSILLTPRPHVFPNASTVLSYFSVYFLPLSLSSRIVILMTHKIKESKKATQKHYAGTGKDL